MKVQPYRRKYLAEYYKKGLTPRMHELWDDNVADILKLQGIEIPHSPRSIYDPDQLFSSLDRYDPINMPKVEKLSAPIRMGIKYANSVFKRPESHRKMDPWKFTLPNIMKMVTNEKASAGLSAFGMTKREAHVRAFERGIQIAQGIKSPEPCLALARTQEKNKTRLVWGYPFSMTALEGVFARPLINVFKDRYRTPMAFAMSDLVLGSKIRSASRKYKYVYSLDMSKFDTSLHPLFTNLAFEAFKSWFNLDQVDEYIGNYLDVFNIVQSYFHTCGIVMPDGNLYSGRKHGVPSGSYFTQLVDSYCNCVIYGAICSIFKFHVDKNAMMVLGDDLLFFCDKKLDLDILAKRLHAFLGVNVNSEKSIAGFADDEVHFLGRIWINGRPHMDWSRMLVRMTQPERFRKYSSNPLERRREAILIVFSFFLLAENAWPILDKITGGFSPGKSKSRKIASSVNFDSRMNPDHVGGFQRYKLVYLDTGETVAEDFLVSCFK